MSEVNTVDMISPSGNPEVIAIGDVEKKKEEGYILRDAAYFAKRKEEAEKEYQERLKDPAFNEERFESLRSLRDLKLSVYDKKINQYGRLQRLGEDVEDQITLWDEYAQALCKLPDQPGAPWDGGGPLTPWPEMPE